MDMANTFFFLMTTRFGMVLRSANEHITSLQSKAEVATESCEGKVAACFCQGYRIFGMDHIHISHLLTHISGCRRISGCGGETAGTTKSS
jgi:hypothetical protein